MQLGAFAVIMLLRRTRRAGRRAEGLQRPARSAIRSRRSRCCCSCCRSAAFRRPPASWASSGCSARRSTRGYYWLAVIGVLNSAISLYYYVRIVVFMYLKKETTGSEPVDEPGARRSCSAWRWRRRWCSASIRGCCSRWPTRRRGRSARPDLGGDAVACVAHHADPSDANSWKSRIACLLQARGSRPALVNFSQGTLYCPASDGRAIMVCLSWLTRTAISLAALDQRPCSIRPSRRTGRRRQLHADRRDHAARRHRLRGRSLARHVALVPARRAAARDRRRDVRAGEDRLAEDDSRSAGWSRPSVASWLAPSAGSARRRRAASAARHAGAAAVAVTTWVLAERTYRRDPARLTGVMMAAFVGKMVFFGAYVAVMLDGLSSPAGAVRRELHALFHRAASGRGAAAAAPVCGSPAEAGRRRLMFVQEAARTRRRSGRGARREVRRRRDDHRARRRTAASTIR